MNLLIIAGNLGTNITGGSLKSLVNIINSLRDVKNIQIKTLELKVSNKLLRFFGFESYVLIPKIIKNILRFKPNIIITQDRMAFPTILVSKIMKIPVICIVRSSAEFCPKFVDVIGYGKACSGINSRNQCFKCINRWRTLRILIGNRKKGSEHTIRTSLMNILYKIRYFACLFHLHSINKANIILVASTLIKDFFSNKINQYKIKIINITPIRKYVNDVIHKKKQFMFVRTYFETSHKGLDFILRLSKFIPKEYWIIVVGGNNPSFMEKGYLNIIKLDYISSKEAFNEVISQCMITLVPTFCTEAFGRVIPESLINKTPVISAPQCGANQFFNDNYSLRVVPLKLDLWIKAIEDIMRNPPIITDNDISQIYEHFSLEKSKKDFIKIIKEVIKIEK